VKAFAIVAAIVCAWISGAGVESGSRHANIGATFFLVMAIVWGVWAWKL
jgi:hypothetical protein